MKQIPKSQVNVNHKKWWENELEKVEMDLPNLLFDLALEFWFDLDFLSKLGLRNFAFPFFFPIFILCFSLRKEKRRMSWFEWPWVLLMKQVSQPSSTQCQAQDPNFRRSKYIDVYTQKGRERHFEHNGGVSCPNSTVSEK